MPFSLKGTILKASIKVSLQLGPKRKQFAIELSREVAVKWLWQFLELLLDEYSLSFYLFSDVR